jgi:hypothetical protein
VLKDAGHIVHGRDIVNYGWPCTVIADYLAEPVEMADVGIVSNPPFQHAEKFVRKAIRDKCTYHAWLLRLQFLESVGRLPLWREHPPARIWISSRRLPMMHREGWIGPRATSTQCFIWAVWDRRSSSNHGLQVGVFDWKD